MSSITNSTFNMSYSTIETLNNYLELLDKPEHKFSQSELNYENLIEAKKIKESFSHSKLSKLPKAILNIIFSFIPPTDLDKVIPVCKFMAVVITSGCLSSVNKIFFNPNVKIKNKKGKDATFFQLAIAKNRIGGVQRFLKHYDGIKFKLDKDQIVDPSAKQNEAFRCACKNGNLELVKVLLADPRVDPTAVNCQPIRLAGEFGHLDIIKFFLEDDRIPPFYKLDVIGCVSEFGHVEVLKELLKDVRFDLTFERNEPIRRASEKGHLNVVIELLRYPQVDPSALDNYAIRLANHNGHLDVVKVLFRNERVRSTINQDLRSYIEKLIQDKLEEGDNSDQPRKKRKLNDDHQ
jgi:hypothetical protein